jgi:hypothetical protein
MKKKKSMKNFLKVGSIIRTSLNEFWEVTCLLENEFHCVLVERIGQENQYTQVFYYTIEMIVFNETARNVD